MYFLTFFPNGAYCFQAAEMTTPCRWGLDEVDLLVMIHSPDIEKIHQFNIVDTVRIEMYNRPPLTGVIRSAPILENPNARAKGVWYDVECPDYVDDDGNDCGLIHTSRLTKITNLKGDKECQL